VIERVEVVRGRVRVAVVAVLLAGVVHDLRAGRMLENRVTARREGDGRKEERDDEEGSGGLRVPHADSSDEVYGSTVELYNP
jgi:hypothetical protein